MSSKYERKLRDILEEYDWLPIRAAGSMGKGDLVAIHPDHENSPLIIEVKKTQKDRIYPARNEYLREQFESMVSHAERGVNACYAVRHNRGDEKTRWQIHWLNGTEERATMKRGEGSTLEETFG